MVELNQGELNQGVVELNQGATILPCQCDHLTLSVVELNQGVVELNQGVGLCHLIHTIHMWGWDDGIVVPHSHRSYVGVG